MTIANTNVKSSYNCNGVTREWDLGFYYDSTLSSILITVAHLDGTTETVTTNYELDGDVLTYPTVESELDPLPEGDVITISRVTPLTQTINLVQQGPLDAETLESGFDKLTMEVQEVKKAATDNMENVTTVAEHISSVDTVASNISNVGTVASISSDVTTVANNTSNINTTAANLPSINAAPTYASNAQKWAEGTDSDVFPLGGTHSSKVWAQLAQQYVESIGSVLHYKGSVATYADLPTTGQVLGDMYNVLSDGANYAWDGTDWDALSGIVNINTFNGADGVNAGTSGLVPSPAATDNTKYLKGNGTWAKVDALPSQTGQSGKFLTTDGSSASWASVSGGGAGKAIGEVYYSQSGVASDNPGGLPLFTGETIANADQLYPDFYDWVADHIALQISAADYASMLTAFGECPKYVIDTTNKTIRLPKISSQKRVLVDSKAPTAQDGSWYNLYSDGWCDQGGIINSNSGTITLPQEYADTYYSVMLSGQASSAGSSTYPIRLASMTTTSIVVSSGSEFDALRWETRGYVTGTSPDRISYPWVCAYNSAVAASTAQAAEFQNALSGKADTNLNNITEAGKIKAAHLAMPSNTAYTDLTLTNASESEYTAPADGYIELSFEGNSMGSHFAIQYQLGTDWYGVYQPSGGGINSSTIAVLLPISAGTKFRFTWGSGSINTTVSWYSFKFIYALGSESEAN